jgi:hypothetical protein
MQPRIYLTLGLVFTLIILNAQTTANFENLSIPDEYLNGSDGSGGFTSGNVFLPNSYNPDFQSFTGWAISKVTDNTTPGFMNQYSAITGEGVNGSANYAVGYAFVPTTLHLEGAAAGGTVEGLYITNSTYAYLSRLNGDSFAKKFGGVTGDDPDFFLLTVKKYQNGTLVENDSIDFYLADYRFSDNSQDYILDEWTYLDLSSLGDADSLQLSLSSSDFSSFGMNNPAYFCVDNIITADATATIGQPSQDLQLRTYPNPATDVVHLQRSTSEPAMLTVYSTSGQQVLQRQLTQEVTSIAVTSWLRGAYFFEVVGQDGKRGYRKVILR